MKTAIGKNIDEYDINRKIRKEKMANIRNAIINSIGVFVYVAIVATIMNNAEKLFGKTDTVATSIGFLMLFTLSAGIVGSLIVGKPIFMYLDGKKKEAVGLLVWTLGCLAAITLIVLLYLGMR